MRGCIMRNKNGKSSQRATEDVWHRSRSGNVRNITALIN